MIINSRGQICYPRTFGGPSKLTFNIKPIKALIEQYVKPGMVVVDPFARDSKYGTITNDLNPETAAQYHMVSHEFLAKLRDDGVQADVILFDPPYSINQVKVSYASVGLKFNQVDAQQVIRWTREMNIIPSILKPDGVMINFGWLTTVLGKTRGYVVVDGMIVQQGAGSYDVLVTVETKAENLNKYPIEVSREYGSDILRNEEAALAEGVSTSE